MSLMPKIAILAPLMLLSACAALSPNAPAEHKGNVYLQYERRVVPRPQIGLALSGGGQKSAPFEMGVLAALEDTGALKSVDVISTVSGGSYAALFYYNRIAERYGYYVDKSPWAGLGSFYSVFMDCLPRPLKSDFTATFRWSLSDGEGLCPHSNPARDYWVPDVPDLKDDPLRYASQVRASQALFALGWSYRDKTKFPWWLQSIAQEGGLAAVNSLLLFPVHIITDNLFDWNIEIAPAKWAYNHGIRRAYGETPTIEPQQSRGRSRGSFDTVNDLKFSDLATIYEESHKPSCNTLHRPCDVPLWVINTTAGTSRSPFVLTDPENFTGPNNTFEFSPYGFGSGAYGRSRWDNPAVKGVSPPITVAQAVGASAGFFDSQQRTFGRIQNSVVNVLLRWLNFDWGSSIPNYNLGKRLYDKARWIHALLPWPLYLLDRHQGDKNALRIHLSDGGMSEDLGVWALIRRKVPEIIVVDAASDSDYKFDDLCHLDLQLHNLQSAYQQSESPYKELFIRFESPRLARFEAVCEEESAGSAPKDPFHFRAWGYWPAPVLKAWVCKTPGMTCGPSTSIATLYIIKPALNWAERPLGGYSLDETIAAGGPPVALQQCSIPNDINRLSSGYPCEVLSYLSSTGYHASPFPQENTVTLSALSSPFIYGAYRDLGRYYGRAIRISRRDGTLRQVRIDLKGYWIDQNPPPPTALLRGSNAIRSASPQGLPGVR